jgi:beta-glucosidase
MSDSPDSQINDPIFDKRWEDSEERSIAVTSNTPNSELSPPDSPVGKSAALKADSRAKSRSLATSLSLEDQVCRFSAICDACTNDT